MTPTTGHPNCMDEFDTGYCEVLAKAIEKDVQLTADRVLSDYHTLPLEHFEPIRKVFGREPSTIV